MTDATYPDLKGRPVLITGGASGIGAGLVEAFVAQGARVGFIDLQRETGEALAERTGAAFACADLTRTDALRAAISDLRARLGPFTVLLNNAASDERHKLEDIDEAYFDARIAVNLKHQVFATQGRDPRHDRGRWWQRGDVRVAQLDAGHGRDAALLGFKVRRPRPDAGLGAGLWPPRHQGELRTGLDDDRAPADQMADARGPRDAGRASGPA